MEVYYKLCNTNLLKIEKAATLNSLLCLRVVLLERPLVDPLLNLGKCSCAVVIEGRL